LKELFTKVGGRGGEQSGVERAGAALQALDIVGVLIADLPLTGEA